VALELLDACAELVEFIEELLAGHEASGVGVVEGSDPARDAGLELDVALLDEGVEVIVDAVGGCDAHDVSDLADRGGASVLVEGAGDDVEHVPLSATERFGFIGHINLRVDGERRHHVG